MTHPSGTEQDSSARAFMVVCAEANDAARAFERSRRLAARLGGRERPSGSDSLVIAFDDSVRAVVCAASCQHAGDQPPPESAHASVRIGLAGTPDLAAALAQDSEADQVLLSDAIVAEVAPRLIREVSFEQQPLRTLAGSLCRPYRLQTNQRQRVFRYMPWSTPRRRAIALTLGLLIFAIAWIGMAITS